MEQLTFTSEEARKAYPENRQTQRDRIAQVLARHPDGLTDYELEQLLSIPRHIAAKRRGELVEQGRVNFTGKTRPTDTGCKAKVWTLAKF